MAAVRGVPLAPEARYRAFAHPEILSEDVRRPPDAGAPPADVSAFPEHMHAYAANCKRTLHYAVHGTLLAKRDRLLHDLGRLRAKALEIASVKAAASREVASVAHEATQRLDAAESLLQTRVRREADELSRQVEEINALAAEVDEAVDESAEDENAMSAEFIGRFRAMYDKCDRLARRPPPAPADADPAAFEKEAKALTNASAERDALKRILEAKDAMIWRLVEERRALAEELRALKAGGGGDEETAAAEPRANKGLRGDEPTERRTKQTKTPLPSESTDPARSARSAVGESPAVGEIQTEVSGREGSDEDDHPPEEGDEEEEEEEEEEEDASASEP